MFQCGELEPPFHGLDTDTMTVAALPMPYLRYDSLDLMRGIAVLGILLVNMWAFAMPYGAYDNPAAYGDLAGANYVVWWVAAVFAQEKFITLFCLLFGAGIALFRDHLIERGQPAAWLHYRRILILLAFGLLHAYLLWFGDVLVVYAFCGLLLYPLLRFRSSLLVALAIALLVLEYSLLWSMTRSLQQLPAEALAEAGAHWFPSADEVSQELAIYRGDWLTQMQLRVTDAWEGELLTFLFYGARLCAQMLLGVVLYRSGILLGQRRSKDYRRLGFVSLGLGLALVITGTQRLASHGFAFQDSLLMGNYWNSAGSLLVATGYAGLIIAWSLQPNPGHLRRLLIQTGKMAFSNYLLTTLICTTLFYGHGFGLFGSLSRVSQLLLTLLIWAALLLWSGYWLQRYQQGPLEWLWRTLSYGTRQPWRRVTADIPFANEPARAE